MVYILFTLELVDHMSGVSSKIGSFQKVYIWIIYCLRSSQKLTIGLCESKDRNRIESNNFGLYLSLQVSTQRGSPF